MKVCTGCKRDLPHSSYWVNKSKSDGLQTQCKECRNIYAKKWYTENSSEQYARVKASRLKLQTEIYEYLLQNPCVDCGEARPECLEFDHVDRATKSGAIGELLANGARHKVYEEIKKCVVRCANCHKVRTAEQFGWYSWYVAE